MENNRVQTNTGNERVAKPVRIELVLVDGNTKDVLLLGDLEGQTYVDKPLGKGRLEVHRSRIFDRAVLYEIDYVNTRTGQLGTGDPRQLAEKLGIQKDRIVRGYSEFETGVVNGSILSYAFAISGNGYRDKLEEVIRNNLRARDSAR